MLELHFNRYGFEMKSRPSRTQIIARVNKVDLCSFGVRGWAAPVMALCGLAVVILAAWFTGTPVTVAEEDLFYTAAVYEHKVVLNPEPKVAVGRKAALQHMNRNLEVFEKQATSAAQQVT